MSLPTISVIVPCRNEKAFISACLKSLLDNTYPKIKTEILVIDGESNDGTLDILKDLAAKNPVVRVISNPKRIFPAAVNKGISNSTGEYIFIIGAHADYPEDYLSKCIEYSIKYDTDNIGGVLDTIPVEKGFTAEIITSVLSNPFGVGNSKFRTGTTGITETDTVFGGCYKRNVFDRWGLLNENLVSTSDYEFNRRIKKNGARIFLVPSIKATYYTRSSFLPFIRNNFRNGYWAIYPIAFTSHFPVSLRHLVPLFFTAGIMTLTFLSFYIKEALLLLTGILSVYLIASLYFSFRNNGNNVIQSSCMPLFFLLLHLTYGTGSIAASFRLLKKS